jgi:hypothetical protein
MHLVEVEKPYLLYQQSNLFYVLGAFFILLAIIDNWAFIFHPFLANVIVDIKSKTDEDRRELHRISKSDSTVVRTSVMTNEFKNSSIGGQNSFSNPSVIGNIAPSFINSRKSAVLN